MNAHCPNCGDGAVPADNYEDGKPDVPPQIQKVVNRHMGSLVAYKCLHPDCSLVFLVRKTDT